MNTDFPIKLLLSCYSRQTASWLLNVPQSRIHTIYELNKETLRLHYHVIRLWEMEAKPLLAMDNAALLALVCQTKISNPAEIIPQVVEKIQSEEKEQEPLIILLAALVEG